MQEKQNSNIQIFIDKPNILDLTKTRIRKIVSNEIFVELQSHKNIYISQYARVLDCRNNQAKLRKTFIKDRTVKNGKRLRIQLPDENNKMIWYPISKLVATIFCYNSDPVKKIRVYHLDKDKNNNNASNLLWIDPNEHQFLDVNIKLHLYDVSNNTLTYFESWERLCDYIQINKFVAIKEFHKQKPIFTLQSGENVRKLEFDGFSSPIYIATSEYSSKAC